MFSIFSLLFKACKRYPSFSEVLEYKEYPANKRARLITIIALINCKYLFFIQKNRRETKSAIAKAAIMGQTILSTINISRIVVPDVKRNGRTGIFFWYHQK